MSDPFSDQVILRCRATVRGQQIEVRQVLPVMAYRDPIVVQAVQDALRHKLVMATLEKWKPVIDVIE